MFAVAEAETPEAQGILWPPEVLVSDVQFLPGSQGGKNGLRLLGRAIDRQEVQFVFVSLLVDPCFGLTDNSFVFDGEYDGII